LFAFAFNSLWRAKSYRSGTAPAHAGHAVNYTRRRAWHAAARTLRYDWRVWPDACGSASLSASQRHVLSSSPDTQGFAKTLLPHVLASSKAEHIPHYREARFQSEVNFGAGKSALQCLNIPKSAAVTSATGRWITNTRRRTSRPRTVICVAGSGQAGSSQSISVTETSMCGPNPPISRTMRLTRWTCQSTVVFCRKSKAKLITALDSAHRRRQSPGQKPIRIR